MAISWRGMNAAVPLGGLLDSGRSSLPALGLVSAGVRELASPSHLTAFKPGAIPRREASPRILPDQAAPALERDVQNLVIGDAALTPSAPLPLVGLGADLRSARPKNTGEILGCESIYQTTELQFTSNPRRIWTRELLAPNPRKLQRAGLDEDRIAPFANRAQIELAKLAPRENCAPVVPAVRPLAPQPLPGAGRIGKLQPQLIPLETDPAPRLIGPRLKVQFGDLKPLFAAAAR